MHRNNNREEFVLAMAGNKCDIDPQQRKVTKEMANDLATKHSMIYRDTSAKSGQGVRELFGEIAKQIAEIKKDQMLL